MINALNSGAKVFMADFEDALSPPWANVIAGQANCIDAVRRTLEYVSPEGKRYQLIGASSRRWWSGPVAGIWRRSTYWWTGSRCRPACSISASTSSTMRASFWTAAAGRTSTCPSWKVTSRHGCGTRCSFCPRRSWASLRGTIRATVLIETILAAFEMDEILYELRDHAAGLNAGRWDYLFSIIKNFRDRPEFLLPDRSQLTMTVPFMQAYTELLVKTCHRRGAHAIGGMAAFIPSRRDPEVNADRPGPGAGRQGARGQRRIRRGMGSPS